MTHPITPESLTALADQLDGMAAAIWDAHDQEPGIVPIAQSLGRASGYQHASDMLRKCFGLPARAGATIVNLEEP